MNSLNIYEQTRIYSSLYLILLTNVIRTINTSNYYYYFEYSYIETMLEQPSNDGAKNSKHSMSSGWCIVQTLESLETFDERGHNANLRSTVKQSCETNV